MTREEYWELAPKYNHKEAQREKRIQAAIDAIPMRINRAGKYYKALLKEIRELQE